MDYPSEKVLALLDDHGERLHALLLRLTLREDAAEDLMQELYLKLAHGNRTVHVRDPLAYAVRVATNLAFDWRRARKRMAHTESAKEGPYACDRSPSSALIANEEFERVLNALESLPRGDRDLIVARYLHGQDYSTMARERGRTPDQVRALCHKALRRLRRVIEKRSSPQRDEGGAPK